MRMKNSKLMEDVKRLHAEGLSDGKIAKVLDERVNQVHYYRYYVLKLKAHQTKRDYKGDHDAKLKGYIIRGVKSSAKRRGIPFDLKHEDIELNSHCPLLGVQLSYKNFLGKTEFNDMNFATVDRIDNAKGYIKGNVWIISRMANNMKNAAALDQLKMFCTEILQRI